MVRCVPPACRTASRSTNAVGACREVVGVDAIANGIRNRGLGIDFLSVGRDSVNAMTPTPPAYDEPLYIQVKDDLGIDPEVIASRPRWSYAQASKAFEASRVTAGDK